MHLIQVVNPRRESTCKSVRWWELGSIESIQIYPDLSIGSQVVNRRVEIIGSLSEVHDCRGVQAASAWTHCTCSAGTFAVSGSHGGRSVTAQGLQQEDLGEVHSETWRQMWQILVSGGSGSLRSFRFSVHCMGSLLSLLSLHPSCSQQSGCLDFVQPLALK